MPSEEWNPSGFSTGQKSASAKRAEAHIRSRHARQTAIDAGHNPYLEDLRSFAPQSTNRNRPGAQFLTLYQQESRLPGQAAEVFGFDLFERQAFQDAYAWGIPSVAAIAALVEAAPLVEIGAGRGYWARLVEACGGVVHAYDATPPEWTYTDVQEGSPECIQEHPEATLFLAWPPLGSAMDVECLNSYTGDTLFYHGEVGDATGSQEAATRLRENWRKVKTIETPQFMGGHDALYKFERVSVSVRS